MLPKQWHNEESREKSNGHTWSEHIPYTNVLWIRYLIHYLMHAYKKELERPNAKLEKHGGMEELQKFKKETTELMKRLNVMTKVKNGAFRSAKDVLDFVYQQGWVNEEQVQDYGDSTILSQ